MGHELLRPLDPSLNLLKLDREKIQQMRGAGIIRNGSPYWWDTDYEPDPREYMPFEEFVQRLSIIPTTNTRIYTREQVPMTTLTLSISGQTYTFMVTARPYHAKSVNIVKYDGMENVARDYPTPQVVHADGISYIFLEDHFIPHIHGLFAGVRGNHLFWYPIQGEDFIEGIYQGLLDRGLPYIMPWINEVGIKYRSYLQRYNEKEYRRARSELRGMGLIAGRRPVFPDFHYSWVSVDEFLDPNENGDLMLHYPLRLSEIEETLPLAIATRTHSRSSVINPAVLGVATGQVKEPQRNDGFWRIIDLDFARKIKNAISEDFGRSVDVIHFNPYGNAQYRRV